MIRDRNMEWLRADKYIPVTSFTGLRTDLLLTGGQSAGVAVQITPDSSGAVIGKTTSTSRYLIGASNSVNQNVRQTSPNANVGARICGINGTGYMGLLLTTAGDFINHTEPWPYDIDASQP